MNKQLITGKRQRRSSESVVSGPLLALLVILCGLDVQYNANILWYAVQAVGIITVGITLIKINNIKG